MEDHSHEHLQEKEHLAHVHGHYHSPEHKKRVLNRLARIIGHLQKVKDMVENDEDCADILVQLSAVNSLIHAMEDGDSHSIEDFQKAIERFL